MKSVKPGRALSFIGGVISVIFVIIGIIWIAMSASPGVAPVYPTFGAVFIVTGIAMSFYWFKNAFGKNRFSLFDIADGDREPDPLNVFFGGNRSRQATKSVRETKPIKVKSVAVRTKKSSDMSVSKPGGFCPHCGAKAEPGSTFCGQCGEML